MLKKVSEVQFTGISLTHTNENKRLIGSFLLVFLFMNASSIISADYSIQAPQSEEKNNKHKSQSVGKEMVGLLLFYLCCEKYTGLQLSYVFLQIKYIAEYAHNPQTLLIYHRPQTPPSPLHEKGALICYLPTFQRSFSFSNVSPLLCAQLHVFNMRTQNKHHRHCRATSPTQLWSCPS